MNVLIKSATIVDAASEFNKQVVDILIEKGKISKISQSIPNPKNYKEVALENLHVSQGWFDSSVSFGEPGFEERETIENGLKTAALSGYTTVALNPNTDPVIDSQADIRFVKSQSNGNAVNLEPIGSLTVKSEGKDLGELFDMKASGAIAYYDYKAPIVNANLMKLALQYTSGFDGLVIVFPQDKEIANKGVMNEEHTSTQLGLRGIPSLAEELHIIRDLFLLEYAGGKLHISTISTKTSVDLIRDAKAKNLNVSCSVAVHNLFMTDDKLNSFDTKYKVSPPLRTELDRLALIEGIKDGTIDMVTSDHNPLDIERKKLEFERADFGTIGLESSFGALNSIFTLKKSIDVLTRGKKRFGLNSNPVNVGNTAELTFFNPKKTSEFKLENIFSTSKNSIFEGEKLKGMAYGIYSNGQLVIQK
ncbi:dihydroorotase [Flavobacteriaceae bacterium MAR_2010_188]|nr:dihydroorotase [Flavobacteriaceae bacterium MAR_2010_188]